jgi:hypothetical protein
MKADNLTVYQAEPIHHDYDCERGHGSGSGSGSGIALKFHTRPHCADNEPERHYSSDTSLENGSIPDQWYQVWQLVLVDLYEK